MNGQTYVILGYVVGLGLLWGYAATLWYQSRRVAQCCEISRKNEAAGDRS